MTSSTAPAARMLSRYIHNIEETPTFKKIAAAVDKIYSGPSANRRAAGTMAVVAAGLCVGLGIAVGGVVGGEIGLGVSAGITGLLSEAGRDEDKKAQATAKAAKRAATRQMKAAGATG